MTLCGYFLEKRVIRLPYRHLPHFLISFLSNWLVVWYGLFSPITGKLSWRNKTAKHWLNQGWIYKARNLGILR